MIVLANGRQGRRIRAPEFLFERLQRVHLEPFEPGRVAVAFQGSARGFQIATVHVGGRRFVTVEKNAAAGQQRGDRPHLKKIVGAQ